MLLSKLFVKTMKEAPAGEVSVNAQLLLRWWFVHKQMAGVYTFLPLGLRVLNKIENIIRKHMDTIGIEIFMPCLSAEENRVTTWRKDTVDVLMKTSWANELSKNKSTNEYILNPTHEDIVTPLVKEYVKSHKDLPVAVYQIQSKFRNEARAKNGLLRWREFRMKDLYSFHATEDDFLNYYEKSKEVYTATFQELWLGECTYLTLASGWDFTEKFSHEFQVVCDAGEDTLYIDPQTGIAYNEEIAPSTTPSFAYSDQFWVIEDIYWENVVSVTKLCEFLNLPIEQTVKTMLYKDEKWKLYAAVVRWDYEVNELKLKKVIGAKSVELISDEEIIQFTWADRWYAWMINLPVIFTLICDDALESMTNIESWTNKTHYHTININRERDLPKPSQFYDIKLAKKWDLAPSGVPYKVEKWCEVGNIFPLETRFPDAFWFTYQDANNQSQKINMWSYGIWPSRVMWVLVEKFHDNEWILRPENVAPFMYCIIAIGEQWTKRAWEVYNILKDKWVDVCLDDRTVWPWFKFKDADLIWYPFQIVIGDKTLEQWDMCELIDRKTKIKKLVSFKELKLIIKDKAKK